ncbi:hypothetical protein WBP_0949 [Wolbachia endosymbiont of Brugia pahangi]|nr:hypothetical protein WBP_0949 [Wolbachia endosymbiont of Brugia pahangi]
MTKEAITLGSSEMARENLSNFSKEEQEKISMNYLNYRLK